MHPLISRRYLRLSLEYPDWLPCSSSQMAKTSALNNEVTMTYMHETFLPVCRACESDARVVGSSRVTVCHSPLVRKAIFICFFSLIESQILFLF